MKAKTKSLYGVWQEHMKNGTCHEKLADWCVFRALCIEDGIKAADVAALPELSKKAIATIGKASETAEKSNEAEALSTANEAEAPDTPDAPTDEGDVKKEHELEPSLTLEPEPTPAHSKATPDAADGKKDKPAANPNKGKA